MIQARSISSQNGEIILSGGDNGIVNVSGTLDASSKNSGETGGTVKVLGEYVGLYDGALIDASGDAGGGTAICRARSNRLKLASLYQHLTSSGSERFAGSARPSAKKPRAWLNSWWATFTSKHRITVILWAAQPVVVRP